MKLTNKIIADFDAKGKNRDLSDDDVTGLQVRITKKKGTKTFYYVYTNAEGKRRKLKIERCDQIGITTARKRVIALKGKVIIGEDPLTEKLQARIKDKKAISLEQYLDNYYYKFLESPKGKHKHPDRTKVMIKHSFIHLFKKSLSKITRKDMEKWMDDEINRGMAPNTINRNFTVIRAALNYAVKIELIHKSPTKGMEKLEAPKGIVRYLSDKEYTRLYEQLDKMTGYMPVIVKLLLNTGCRPVEIYTLEWTEVNFKLKLMTVLAQNAKNKKERHIPLNKTAVFLLETWRAETASQEDASSNHVFISPNTNKPFKGVYRQWLRLAKASKLNNFRLYDCRHDFASKLVMKGVDLYTVSQLLGHSSVTMTQIYAHLSPDHLAGAVDLLD